MAFKCSCLWVLTGVGPWNAYLERKSGKANTCLGALKLLLSSTCIRTGDPLVQQVLRNEWVWLARTSKVFTCNLLKRLKMKYEGIIEEEQAAVFSPLAAGKKNNWASILADSDYWKAFWQPWAKQQLHLRFTDIKWAFDLLRPNWTCPVPRSVFEKETNLIKLFLCRTTISKAMHCHTMKCALHFSYQECFTSEIN